MKRPFGVWLILVYAAISTLIALYGFALLFAGKMPYTHALGSVVLLDYALSLLYSACIAAGAVALFMLRKLALRLFAAAAAFKFLIMTWQLLTHRFLVVGTSPAVMGAFVLSWAIVIAIILYTVHLQKNRLLV